MNDDACSAIEWCGEVFDHAGQWVGTLACDEGAEMLACLEELTFSGLSVRGVCRRPRRLVLNAFVVNGPASRAAAIRAIQTKRAEVAP